MSSLLPSEIQQLIVCENHVYACVSDQIDTLKYALKMGKKLSTFQDLDPAQNQLPNFGVSHRPAYDRTALAQRVEPTGETTTDGFAIWINELDDWALSNTETVQLMINDFNRPARVSLTAPIEFRPHSDDLVFQAKLAAHRANARLIVTIKSLGYDTDHVFEHPVDPSHPGGRSAANYLLVSFDVPKSNQPISIHMDIMFDEYVAEEQQMEPFVFLSDVHATRRKDLNERPIGKKIWNDHAVAAPRKWITAMFPAMMDGHKALHMTGPKLDVELLSKGGATVSLLNDYGHTMELQSNKADEYLIYIDQKLVLRTYIGTDHTHIRLPAEYLTGDMRNFQVRDTSGSQILLNTYVLLPYSLTPVDVNQREGRRPFAGPLMAQSKHRYQSLKAVLKSDATKEQQTQAAFALDTLEGGYENVKLKPLAFPFVKKPDVSIIIPAHNKVEITYFALCSLLLAQNNASFEVIVVDDASTDETAELEKIVSGITVIHNEQAQRFIKACNAGVAKAKGKYVVLLNNDVEVTTGWLDELISGFSRFDGVGAVGSKLLYPDGSLQDAGGIIWGSGNPWNYGNSKNPWAPEFCYARQADYLSGAALMTTKKIWDHVGGLSNYLEPMYFEDTDFSFKVREAGYKTYFIPSSIIYHYEGMTSGTDVSSGFKRYQEVNRPKFKRQWAKAYAHFGKEGHRPDLEKDRGIIGRVLFIDYTTPRADRDAGSYAAIQEIKLVQSLGYKVTFLPQNIAYLDSYTEELQKMGVEVIHAPFILSVDEYIEQHGADFDAFYITRYYVGNETIPLIRKVAPHARVLFNNADLHFLRELRAGLADNDSDKIEAARSTRDKELKVMKMADVILSYNDSEHAVITSHIEGCVPVVRCPWVVEAPEKVAPQKGRAGLSFLGSFHHHPNVEGVEWFANEVMPQLLTKTPDLTLDVYGSGMQGNMDHIISDNIRTPGFVENLSDAFDQHRIFVAPLLSGAGIKGKVLAALAHGVPCVVTPTAAESIGLRDGHDCFIVTTPDKWVKAINQLLGDNDLWQKMSANSHQYIVDRFSFANGRELMRAAFENVGLFRSIDD